VRVTANKPVQTRDGKAVPPVFSPDSRKGTPCGWFPGSALPATSLPLAVATAGPRRRAGPRDRVCRYRKEGRSRARKRFLRARPSRQRPWGLRSYRRDGPAPSGGQSAGATAGVLMSSLNSSRMALDKRGLAPAERGLESAWGALFARVLAYVRVGAAPEDLVLVRHT
jgi:hypothetical protein